MKFLIACLVLVFSAVALGNSCEEKVLADYVKALKTNEYHHLTGDVRHFNISQKSFNYYGIKVELGYDIDVDVYIAGSEFHGGYGLEALVVDPASCKTLKMVNVYAE